MASSLTDSVVHWRKKLERNTDETVILNVIHKLSKIPVKVELLQETGIGKVIRGLAKQSGNVGLKAHAVLCKWREVLSSNETSSEKPQKIKHEKNNAKKMTYPIKQVKTIEKPQKKSSSNEKNNGKLKQSTQTDSKKYSAGEIPKHLSAVETHTKRLSRDIHSDKMKLGDINFDINSDIQFSLGNEHMDVNVNEKSAIARGPVSKKQKVETSESFNSSLSSKNHSKSELKKRDLHNSHKKKDRDRKSHSSSGQSDSKSSRKSQSHNDPSKSSETEKLQDKKTKKKDSDKKTDFKIKKTSTIHPSEAFTSSEVSFEDCLSFNDELQSRGRRASKKKSSKLVLNKLEKPNSSKKNSLDNTSSKPKVMENMTVMSKSQNGKQCSSMVITPEICIPLPRSSTVDILSTLPQIQPNYRPLPQRNYDFCTSKKKVLTNEDAIKFTSSRREKTAVYSGKKNIFGTCTEIPSLFESCLRVLIENIDAIEYLGDLPYFILKPVFERASPAQLHNIEFYNAYLLEDTHELWEVHCKRDFRNNSPGENETWRELYWRVYEEREKRLKSITANISASMSKSGPARKVKLAYVDSVAKPPRDVARKQAKHGTALPVNHIVKGGPPSKATSRPTAPAANSASSSRETFIPKKPKVAPLMAKTLKSMKQCFRR